MPYHHGLVVVECVGIHRMDVYRYLLVLAAVALTQLISCVIALAPSAPGRYLGLVHWIYRNRVRH